MNNLNVKMLIAFLVGGLLVPPGCLLYTAGFNNLMGLANSFGGHHKQVAYQADKW